MEMTAATLSRSKPLRARGSRRTLSRSFTRATDHVNAGAQFRIGLSQLETTVQIVIADDSVLQSAIELKVRQRLEQDAALIDGAQARRANIALQRFLAVGTTMSV